MKHSKVEVERMIKRRKLEIKGWQVAREFHIERQQHWEANWLGEQIGAMQRAVDKAQRWVDLQP